MKDLNTRIYFITDSTPYTEEEFLARVKSALKGGATLIQLREKERTTREYISLAQKVHELSKQFGVPLIIDDRVDVALAAEVEGVHLAPQVHASLAGEIHLMLREKVFLFLHDRLGNEPAAHFAPVARDVEDAREFVELAENVEGEKRARAFGADGAVRVERVVPVADVQVFRGRRIIRDEHRLLGAVVEVPVVHEIEAFG